MAGDTENPRIWAGADVLVAPLDTAVPTDVTTAWNAAFDSLGLLSEDIDPASGELWGNFPQTYSLVGIIQCATRLSRPWEDAR